MSALKVPCLLALVILGRAPGQEAGPRAGQPAQPKPEAALALERSLRARLAEPMETLDLDLVMFGDDFFGAEPQGVRWTDDGSAVVFEWKKFDEPVRGTWCFTIATGKLERLADETPPPVRGVFSPDRRRRAFAQGKAILVEDVESHEVRELYRGTRASGRLTFSADGCSLFIVSNEGIVRIELERGGVAEVLAIKKGKEPKDDDEEAEAKKADPAKDLSAWHKEEQRTLFRVLFEREDRERAEKKARRAREKAEPSVVTYWVADDVEVEGVVVSPAGDRAAISLRKEKKKGRVAEMPDYVTADGFTKTRTTRAKAGDGDDERFLEIVTLENGARLRVEEPVADCGAAPSRPRWSPDGCHLLASAASKDDEHSWLLKIDLDNGKVKVLHELIDPAWVLQKSFDLDWLGTSPVAVFHSESTGYTHVWRVDAAAGEVRQLTRGRFEVFNLEVPPAGTPVYAVATPTSPHVRDLVEIDPSNGALTVLTAESGGRSCTLSPDGTRMAEVFSAADRPPELRIRWLHAEREPAAVTDSPSPAFKSWGGFQVPEIVRIPASDGHTIPARIYRPREPRPGHPAVLFVHGAGYLQNVHTWWSSYAREYAFHHVLRDEGFTVLDVDYRGSAGYGRDWRTAISGHMGGRDLEDYVDAARWLVEHEGVGKDRIGIYGGSYGGFLTLMALFTRPGVFKAGAALRPVTDWAHYNDTYTSNILDTPLESPEAYARSSPIHFADGLRDHLLICHGLLDDNVHAQDSIRLLQRLIELRKTTFDVALYPLENHGFRDAASWSDEYRRIHDLFLSRL